jgi:hypothetical protein
MTTNRECKFRREVGKSIRLSKHAKGFLTYSIEAGPNVIFVFKRDIVEPGKSSKKVVEAVFELTPKVPNGISIPIQELIIRCLYRSGGPMIQFESSTCDGTLKLDGEHGDIKVIFRDPSIDIAAMKTAPFECSF